MIVLQAYVFALLTAVYIDLALHADRPLTRLTPTTGNLLHTPTGG